jgi:hypothetical protein
MTRVKMIDAPLINAGKAMSTLAGTLAVAAAAALLSMPASADTPAAKPAPAPATAPAQGDQNKLPESDANGEWVMVGAISKGNRSEKADDGQNAPPALPAIEDDGH